MAEGQAVGQVAQSVTSVRAEQSSPARKRRAQIAAIYNASALGGKAKRALDLAFAASMLIVAAPLMLIVATAVRLTSSGPALYWSERVGRNGKSFRMPKFRTMRVGAPVKPREQFADADGYLTPIGRFLRSTSLDEIPQLISVLRGDMSFIGPRPLVPSDPTLVERATRAELLHVRPGVTGLAQIRGRNFLTPSTKARYDALYARRWTMSLDAWIFGVTVQRVLSRADIL